MIGFWMGAAALAAAALAFLLVPLVRQRKASGRWSLSAAAAAVLTVPAAFLLHSHLTTWQPELLDRHAEERRLIAQLAERMAQNPEDAAGWQLLGQSYLMLDEYAMAREAFAEAWRRTPSPDNALKLSFAEALILEDQAQLTGEAGRLVEEVLAEEPDNPAALWYGGQRAISLGDAPAAQARLTRLLDLGSIPEAFKQFIRAQLAQLPGAEADVRAAAAGEGGGRDEDDDPMGQSVAIEVKLAEGLPAEALGPNAVLFIFAQPPGGGTPVAALRVPADALPGAFVLSDRDAMLPGHSLGDFPELSLVALVSASGEAARSPGDLYGERRYRPAADESIDLVIDKVVQ